MTVVGMFDSGVGGLSVLRQVLRLVPGVDVVYYADNAHLPYGDRSKEELESFTTQIIDYLTSTHGAEVIVIACNTSSATALPLAKQRFALPILSVLEAGVEGALRESRNNSIGVIATRLTVESGAYERAFLLRSPQVKVISAACPPLVPLVESGELSGRRAEKVVRDCLSPFEEREIDTLVLGCTHYTFLAGLIAQSLPSSVTIVDPAVHVAEKLARMLGFLKADSEINIRDALARVSFYTSGDPESFSALAGRLLSSSVSAKREYLW